MADLISLSNSLSQAALTFPFDYLGLCKVQNGAGYVLRVWQPGASQVELLEFKRNRVLGECKAVGAEGLFELKLPKRRAEFNYRLRVTCGDQTVTVIDPYQFKHEAYYGVHHVSSQPQNIYQQLGAHRVTLANGSVGTRVIVFAPNAKSCSLIGDINQWDGRCLPMQKTQCGHFVLVVPSLHVGERYKFELKAEDGSALPHKSDPVGFYHEQYPSFASIVYDHSQYKWGDQEWIEKVKSQGSPHRAPMNTYEVHLGSWKMKQTQDGSQPLNYQELINELIPYVKEMGYTHIEVLPVSEHPFTGSWGYQPTGMFAATSRFGDPDGFKAFVDACHQHELAVIIDWVPAHFPEDPHGLAKFDGTSLYEYDDPQKGWHPDWNSCIYDYGKDSVRQFLVASALYWLDKFHVDGIRVDAVASMLYLDYSRNDGEWVPNIDGGNHNYEAISLLKWMNEAVHLQFPQAITIAEESTSYPGVSKPTFDGGLGFDFKWNMGWMHDSLVFISKDPMYRKYHHNDITFSMVYNYDEQFVLPISHDEVVHGKGSLIRKMPGDEWQQAANQRAFAAYMMAHPGKKLNFMGSELAQWEEWNHNTGLSWHVLEHPKNKGMQALYKKLNLLYKDTAPLYQLDHDRAGFDWLDHEDAEHSILSFIRKDDLGNTIVVVANFTPVPRDNYRIGVNKTGSYSVVLNTDSDDYWGSAYPLNSQLDAIAGQWQQQPYSVTINLPPLAVMYLAVNETTQLV